MRILIPLLALLAVSGCVNHCRDPIIVVGVSGYHHDCKMECHGQEQPKGFKCRCSNLCPCVAHHPITSR